MKQVYIFCLMILGFFQHGFGQNEVNQLQDSISYFMEKAKFERALPFAEKLVKKLKTQNKEPDSLYLRTETTLGELLSKTRNFVEAEKVLTQNAADIAKILGPKNLLLSRCHQVLGGLFDEKQDFKTAEGHFLKAIEIRQASVEKEDHETGVLYNNLGSLYYAKGLYDLAEIRFNAAFAIWHKIHGDNHKLVGMAYSNLGIIADLKGKFEEAEKLYLRSIDVKTKVLGPTHPDVALSFGNLGSFYFAQSQYPKAEDCYQKSLEIRLANHGENNIGVARMYNNLGMLNAKLGQFEKAETNYLKAIKIRVGLLGENHPQVAESYVALAVAYSDQGKLAQAKPYFLKTIDIQKQKLGENHPTMGTTYNNTGNLFYRMHNYAQAETYYQKALEIRLKVFGEKNQYVASCYNNLATLFNDKGELSKSEEYYQKALKTYYNAVGEWHQDVATAHFQLARNLVDEKKYEEAYVHLKKGTANYLHQIKLNFPILSENEKQLFFQNLMKENLENLASFSILEPKKYPEQLGQLYNTTLSTKALILNSTQKFRKRISQIADTNILKRFEMWEKNRREIARIYQGNDSTELLSIKSLQSTTETLEKDLGRLTKDFAGLGAKKLPDWVDIRKKLKKNEAAVEILRIKKYGNVGEVADTSNPKKLTYKLRGLTDSLVYVALIVKKGLKYPELVILQNGNELEDKSLKYYRNCVQKLISDEISYDKFWEPIGRKLGNKINRVYFSPEGVFHSINLNILKNPRTGKYLLDEVEIKQVTNTKDILIAYEQEKNRRFACLVGFPDYNLSASAHENLIPLRAKHENELSLKMTRNELFTELPGTKLEVLSISGLLKNQGFNAKELIGDLAMEASIKELNQPKILHIATHGFFHSDTAKAINPLLFSGLVLSGANKTLAGQPSNQIEDGILTAYEAMNLNLDNTNLVVLSACETGLGEVKVGEGVYGLQRAFKVAGAQNIIMSLWKVDDEATQELMGIFYRNWLQQNKRGVNPKNGLRAAFLSAQKELKAKYPHPYYWGAFVLVGE